MTSNLISIIIPAYNSKDTLPACLNSILNQKFNNFELILVDNGSTDATSALCDGYRAKDPRVRVIHMKHDEIASAWNAGLEAATGRYIIFMDGADYIEEDCFDKFTDHLWQDFDVIFMRASEIHADGTKNVIPGFNTLAGQSHNDVLQKFTDKLPDKTWDKLIRRRVLTENNIQFTPGGLWEDVDFCMSLYLNATTYGVLADVPCYCRTIRNTKRDPKEWCHKLILTLSKWTGEAELNYKEHNTIIHHWMAALYCDELIPLYGKLPAAERKALRYAMDDFAWLLDVRKTGSDRSKKSLYNLAGPWGASHAATFKDSVKCLKSRLVCFCGICKEAALSVGRKG